MSDPFTEAWEQVTSVLDAGPEELRQLHQVVHGLARAANITDLEALEVTRRALLVSQGKPDWLDIDHASGLNHDLTCPLCTRRTWWSRLLGRWR